MNCDKDHGLKSDDTTLESTCGMPKCGNGNAGECCFLNNTSIIDTLYLLDHRRRNYLELFILKKKLGLAVHYRDHAYHSVINEGVIELHSETVRGS